MHYPKREILQNGGYRLSALKDKVYVATNEETRLLRLVLFQCSPLYREPPLGRATLGWE